MTMLNRATSPDLFAEECDNLKGIFLKLKLINSIITRFITSQNQASLRCSRKCSRSDYSAVQWSKISWHCTKTAVLSWKENKQWLAPSLQKQESCQWHQSTRGQTTINKSTMCCLQIQMWSMSCGLCWQYSPTPFPMHWGTQAFWCWKTPGWRLQSEEQRSSGTIYHS